MVWTKIKFAISSLLLMPCLKSYLSNLFFFFLGEIEASFDVYFVGERLQDQVWRKLVLDQCCTLRHFCQLYLWFLSLEILKRSI